LPYRFLDPEGGSQNATLVVIVVVVVVVISSLKIPKDFFSSMRDAIVFCRLICIYSEARCTVTAFVGVVNKETDDDDDDDDDDAAPNWWSIVINIYAQAGLTVMR